MGIEMVTIGGRTVARDWANTQTATESQARQYLDYAEENIRRGYFPAGHENEAAFIRAKYPAIAAAVQDG